MLTRFLRKVLPSARAPATTPTAPDIFAAGKFPLCIATHDQGLRWLFDLSTVLLLLDCRPGDRVLDLGAGSGFSSEMLARLGYHVVAVDPDLVALDHNRHRRDCDRSRIDGTVTVAGAVAEHLPFAAQSFDGVVCMNVLHHVSALDVALTELNRVLKPGCRVVFCEPGIDHLAANETARAIKEHGEEDKPFDVLLFLKEARRRGYKQAMLTATLQSAVRLLPIEEVELYRSGRHTRPHLTPQGVIDELHRRHAYGMLVRDGVRPFTSRYPGRLKAAIHVGPLPPTLRRGATCNVTIGVENTGDTTWLAEASPLGGYVTLGCKLLRLDGRLITDGLGRTLLPYDVPPSTSVEATAELCVPQSCEPGHYVIRFDVVNELICWFSDLPENTCYEVPVVIT